MPLTAFLGRASARSASTCRGSRSSSSARSSAAPRARSRRSSSSASSRGSAPARSSRPSRPSCARRSRRRSKAWRWASSASPSCSARRSAPRSAATSSTTTRWPWIFYINLPVGLLGLFMVWRIVHDPPYLERVEGERRLVGHRAPRRRPRRAPDAARAGGAVQLVRVEAERHLRSRSRSPSLVMFVVWELTVDKPAVNLRVLKNRSLATGTAIGARARRGALLDALPPADLHAGVPRLQRDADGPRAHAALARHARDDPDRRRHLQQDLPAHRHRVRVGAGRVHLLPDEPLHPDDEPRGDPLAADDSGGGARVHLHPALHRRPRDDRPEANGRRDRAEQPREAARRKLRGRDLRRAPRPVHDASAARAHRPRLGRRSRRVRGASR